MNMSANHCLITLSMLMNEVLEVKVRLEEVRDLDRHRDREFSFPFSRVHSAVFMSIFCLSCVLPCYLHHILFDLNITLSFLLP